MTTQAGAAPQAPDLTWGRAMRLGVLGLASDIRDRGATRRCASAASAHALDPRLHRPIFVIGAPSSGTTFLGSCLGRMPGGLLPLRAPPDQGRGALRIRRVMDRPPRRRCSGCPTVRCCSRHCTVVTASRRRTRRTASSCRSWPRQCPDAQFVHIVRDGRDATVSHAEQPWLNAASAARASTAGPASCGVTRRAGGSSDRGARSSPRVSDIVRSAWCWRRFTEAALDGLATLAPGRAMEVRYEAMVSDPVATADHLAGFLGTSRGGRGELRAAMAQARPDSVGRWRATLSGPDVAELEAEIGPLLTRLGYA